MAPRTAAADPPRPVSLAAAGLPVRVRRTLERTLALAIGAPVLAVLGARWPWRPKSWTTAWSAC